MTTLEIRKISRVTGSPTVVETGSYDSSDPAVADVVLRGKLAGARLLSACTENEYSVGRKGEACEIARYCGGKRV
jgi:hypothetical protein